MTITLNACFNEFSLDTQRNNNDRLQPWLVQTKFNMGTLDLEKCTVFWPILYICRGSGVYPMRETADSLMKPQNS